MFGVFALATIRRRLLLVVYREPVTEPRSRGIMNRHLAISNKLATKPNPNPTLTLALALPLTPN